MSNLPIKATTEKMGEYIDRMVPEFEKIFSDKKTAMRFGRLLLAEFNESTALQACTPQSILACMMDLATLDLEPGGALGLAHFVPFGGVCVLIVDYKGLINLVTRSGVIAKISARVVHANDEFFVEYGTKEDIVHKPPMEGERGEVTHYYAVGHHKDGTKQFEVMTLEQVNAIRDRSQAWMAYKSKGKTCPWVTHPDEMGRKTVVKRLVKYLPIETLPTEARDVLHREDEVFYRTLGNGEFSVQDVTEGKLLDMEQGAKAMREEKAQQEASSAPEAIGTPVKPPPDAPERRTGDEAPHTRPKPTTPPEASPEPPKATPKKPGRPKAAAAKKKAPPKEEPAPPKPEMTAEEKAEHLNAQNVAWDLAVDIAKEELSTAPKVLKEIGADLDETMLEDMTLERLKEVTEELDIRLQELKGVEQ